MTTTAIAALAFIGGIFGGLGLSIWLALWLTGRDPNDPYDPEDYAPRPGDE